jgi:HEAT repeat protein
LALPLLLLAAGVQAQDTMSTSRIEAQHKPPSSMAAHVPQYETNLVKMLDNENLAVQAQAVQTIRDLEQMFPKYSFKLSLAPLEKKLKDENADVSVRLLTALALDELHSDAGDAVIKDVANSSQNKGLQTLCTALQVRSQYK